MLRNSLPNRKLNFEYQIQYSSKFLNRFSKKISKKIRMFDVVFNYLIIKTSSNLSNFTESCLAIRRAVWYVSFSIFEGRSHALPVTKRTHSQLQQYYSPHRKLLPCESYCSAGRNAEAANFCSTSQDERAIERERERGRKTIREEREREREKERERIEREGERERGREREGQREREIDGHT